MDDTAHTATPTRKGRVCIETYGCTFNVSDSEVMAGLLERGGYEVVESPDHADAVILNSCTVKDRTYLEFRKRVRFLDGAAAPGATRRPALILAGCVPRVPQQSREFEAYSQVGPDNLASIAEVVERVLAGGRVSALTRKDSQRLALPTRRRNSGIEIIPISKGCLGSCTFCQTVLARGRLRSFPAEEIAARVERAVADGVRVVWLTSQDCGAYGMDTGTSLPALLRRVARLPGDFVVRVGMANPDFVKLHPAEFTEALAHPKVLRFAHIPVQSGSDRVLADMARMYTADDFRRICDILRARLPGVTIATDIIAGYPTETDADWQQTLRLLNDTAPGVVNRSRFSPRPGTRAARLPALASRTVSARSRELYAVARGLTRAHLAGVVGTRLRAHAEEDSGRGVTMFRTRSYQPVSVPGTWPVGTAADILVTGIESFHLVGEIAG